MVKKSLAYDLPRITIRLDVFVKNGKFFIIQTTSQKCLRSIVPQQLALTFTFVTGLISEPYKFILLLFMILDNKVLKQFNIFEPYVNNGNIKYAKLKTSHGTQNYVSTKTLNCFDPRSHWQLSFSKNFTQNPSKFNPFWEKLFHQSKKK